MIIIINIDATHFQLNGLTYDKSFRGRLFSNDKIALNNIFNNQELQKPELFNQYEIDGVVYGTIEEAINALNLVIYSGVGGAVTVSDENGTPQGLYNPMQTMSYNRLNYTNVDSVRSSIAGFTGSIQSLFEDQYSTIVNNSADAIKTVDVIFKLSLESIIAVLQTSTGDFSNVKVFLLYSSGSVVPIFDNSLDNTKIKNEIITAPDVIGANGVRFEFHTVDPVTLGSLFVPQLNTISALIQARDTLTGKLQTINSTNGLLNVFTKEKEYESAINKWGQNDNIGTGTIPETIYDGSNLYTYTEVAVTYAASSTDAADALKLITAILVTKDVGTGDLTEELVTLALDGQNKVTFVPPSGNLVVGCQRAYNANGILLTGDVYIYESQAAITGGIPNDAALIRSIITIEAQQTRQTVYIVPDIDSKGQRILEAHVIKWYGAIFKTTTVVADIFFMVQEPGGVMRARDVGTASNNVPTEYEWGDQAPLKIPTRSRIEIRCVNVSANNGAIIGKYQLQNVTENEKS